MLENEIEVDAPGDLFPADAPMLYRELPHERTLVAPVAETVVGLQDAIGSQALEWAIAGLAAERPLREVFAEQRARYAAAIDRLQEGADPRAVLPAGL